MMRRRDTTAAPTKAGGTRHLERHSTSKSERRRLMMGSPPNSSREVRLIACIAIGLTLLLLLVLLIGTPPTTTSEFLHVRNPSSPGQLPNLLLAGPQKAGTTSIFTYLESLNKNDNVVCISRRFSRNEPSRYEKEVHFFDDSSRYKLGLQFYKDRFRHCGEQYSIVVDGSPKTLGCTNRVYETYKEDGTLDQVKMIVVLREPVRREISQYNMFLRNRQAPASQQHRVTPDTRGYITHEDGTFLTFEEYAETHVIPHVIQGTKNQGLYGVFLKDMFELIPNRKQILVLSFDEMSTNQTTFLRRIHQFLDLPMPSDESSMALPATNSEHDWWKDIVPPCAIQDKLALYYEESNAQAYDLLNKYPGPDMEQRPFPRYQYRCEEES